MSPRKPPALGEVSPHETEQMLILLRLKGSNESDAGSAAASYIDAPVQFQILMSQPGWWALLINDFHQVESVSKSYKVIRSIYLL